MRVAYLGPPGTYTHEALLEFTIRSDQGPAGSGRGAAEDGVEAVPLPSIHDVVMAVQTGAVHEGVVPIENSLEGSVNATLDALAFATEDVVIVGELVRGIHHCLIAGGPLALEEIELVASHPQALAQCASFLRERLPQASLRAAASTAEAVRAVLDDGSHAGSRGERMAALGPRSAAERYGGRVLAADVEDVAGNETRFARLARRASHPPGERGGGEVDGKAGEVDGKAGEVDGKAGEVDGKAGEAAAGPGYKTAVAFWPRESDHPGWLVDCLSEFARRGVNLTRIESRPRKVGLGEYVFFVDLAGAVQEPAISAGLEGVRTHVAQLRVLGSFPVA